MSSRAYAALKNALPYLEHLVGVLAVDDPNNPSELLDEIRQTLADMERCILAIG